MGQKAQLTSLLLHLAGEAVHDVMESLELTTDEDGEENYILPDHRCFGQVFYCSSQPYLRATCFPPDEPKANGDGEPVRYQAQNTSSVLFFC